MTTWTLIGHGLWIAGLALLLTIGSFQSWRYADEPKRQSNPQSVTIGLLMVTSGLLLVSTALIERSLWGILTLVLAVALGRSVWHS
ncbi:MAG: hypothetical protein WCI67_08655 [Chloroflexales bacterium]